MSVGLALMCGPTRGFNSMVAVRFLFAFGNSTSFHGGGGGGAHASIYQIQVISFIKIAIFFLFCLLYCTEIQV